MSAEVNAALGGKWVLDRDENFSAFLGKTDLGMMKKKMATSLKPTLVIAVEGDVISVSISVPLKTNANKFKLGEEFDAESEGKPSKAISTWADGKLTTVLTPIDSKFKPVTVVREVIDGELVQTMTLDGVTCKRIFKKCT